MIEIIFSSKLQSGYIVLNETKALSFLENLRDNDIKYSKDNEKLIVITQKLS